MRKQLILLSALLMVAKASMGAECLPENLLVTGLINNQWQLYQSAADCKWERIPTKSEPRTPTLSSHKNRLAYIAANGDVREIDLRKNSDSLLFKSNKKDSYTQLAYDKSGQDLLAVKLKSGSSADSDIVIWQRSSRRIKPEIVQRSAQFEPHFASNMSVLYGSVSCVSTCGKIIQEIWLRDKISGEADQLTLLNAVSRQPFYDAGSEVVVFSSNKKYHFHIWSYSFDNRETQQLTQGSVTDFNPVIVAEQLFFIRKSANGTHLMRMNLSEQSKPQQVALSFSPADLKELRYGGQ